MSLLHLVEQLESDVRNDVLELATILGVNLLLAVVFILVAIQGGS